MTTYNGYELNYTVDELKKMTTEEMTDVVLLSETSQAYESLAEGDKKALKHLVAAAKILNNVSLTQDNPHNIAQKKALENAATTGDEHATLALKLFNSLNGVSGLNGIDADPINIFKGLTTPKGKNFYPADLSEEEFHNILLKMFQKGEINAIRRILSARTMVVRDEDKLKAIDYTEYFKNEFSEMANELEVAAHYCTNNLFKEFLSWQAQALLQNNEDMDMLADKHWAMMQATPLEFTLSRENYDDEMTSTVLENPKLAKLIKEHNIEVIDKDMLGARVGIVNLEGTKLLLEFKDTMPKLCKMMPFADKYEQNISSDTDVKQTMVDVDLVSLTGDYAQCRGGMTLAQNLPNNDKLAIKTGGGRRNVYHRQVRQSNDAARTKKMLDAFLHPDFHKYYDVEADHIFVIGHENGHSLGPSSEYQNSPGICKSIIEENKADTISISFMPEYVKQGIITEERLKQIYTTWIFRLLLRAKPIFPTETYKIIDLIEFNTLLKHGAIWFDDDKLLHIDFDKISPAMYELLTKVIDIQLSKSPEKAHQYIKENTEWNELHEHIAAIHKKLGLKKYRNIVSYF
ncbi:MAG: hypothetical protein NC218_00825 [Acetobacter sp.]|nr:hypothetical protein [Acetobacter sp.]